MQQPDTDWGYTLQNIEGLPTDLFEDVEIPIQSVEVNGKQLRLSCKFLDTNKHKDQLPDTPKFQYSDSKYYLFVHNDDGSPVAIGILTLFHNRMGDFYEGKSTIIVADEERGNGIASALVDPSKKLLQFVADKRQKPIELEVWNRNLENLQELQRARVQDADAIAIKSAEQERWQHLYGDSGKFGVGKENVVTTGKENSPQVFRMVFHPQKADETVPRIKQGTKEDVGDATK
ncbi:MAG: GNAT family N-acetyltransferase [bacterium]|nr:GNAT family N-acetyltransferase [bacterium]